MNKSVRILVSPDDFDLIVGKGNVLIDFYADWCEPCKWLDPILEEVLRGIRINLSIVKINTDTHLSITQKFDVRSIPVLLFFVDGKQMWRMNGFLTTRELIQKLEQVSREIDPL